MRIYFIVSDEIGMYLLKMSDWYELFFHSIFALYDFDFLHCFKSGCYLHFRFLNISNFFVSKLKYQAGCAFFS